ncbi:hypothetical protein C8J57DRAFT_1458271 [Mycena rebaudengoi]|nr:hypothetical protein C8J57DRAFT_1458271 [Mycena rebaudengoi]
MPDSPSLDICCGNNARSLFSTGLLIDALLLPFALDLMDPVSAVGLVASILQLVAAAKSAIDLGRDAVNATTDQRDLLLEIQNLTPLLEDLKHRLQQPNNQSVNVKLEKPLEQLKGTMEHIARKLGSANKVGSTALIWTFWNKTEVDADLAKIERFKTVLNAWLLLDTCYIRDVGQQQEKNHSQIRQDQYRLLAEVKNLAQNEQDYHESAGLALSEISKMLSSSSNTQRQDNYRILTEVKNVAQDQRDVMDSAEREKIIDWLSPLNFFARHADIFGTLQEGTGRWLLEDPRFRTWLLSPGEIIWCSGIPGAGKTVLASFVVDYLRSHMQSDSIVVAVAYLNHKESEVQSPSNILAGLWWQLVLERPISAFVQKSYQKHQKQRTRPPLYEVCEIVGFAVAEWSKVFIVVDALDEYPEAHRCILLDTLTTIGVVSLLLTSRPNIAPKSFFPTVPVLEIRAREEDIRRYIDAHIQTSSRLSKHVQVRPELRGEIESKIISNVEGMQVLMSWFKQKFLLAKLHMDSLAIKTTVKAVRDALKNLPEDLEDTYNEAMDRIEAQNKDDREIARRALIWVANAKRPLSVHELREALAIELGATTLDADGMLDIEFIVSVCAGLLIVDQAVRLVHYTTQDYIDRVQPSRFPRAQTEITSQCLTYISFNDFSMDRSQNTWSLYSKHKLLSYASHYCLLHAAGEPESLLQESIIDFLSDAHHWWSPSLSDKVPSQWYDLKWPSVSSKLWVAAIFGLQEITKHLLEFDQSISKEEKESALVDASHWNCPGVLRLLINHGTNVNAAGGSYGNALHAAAAMGHVSVVQELIANRINVNIRGIRYSSALNAALEEGHEEVAKLLIRNGADVNLQGGKYRTPLRVASGKGAMEVVQLLLEHGADVSSQGGYIGTALLAASAEGHTGVVQLLLEHGADVDAQGGYSGTALQAASARRNITVVQLLLDHGADVNLQGGHHGNALQAVSAQGDITVVQFLLENGADVNTQGGYYGTALQAASAEGRADVVQLLLEHGADVNVQGGRYGGALQAASATGKEEMVQLLLAHGASRTINARAGLDQTETQKHSCPDEAGGRARETKQKESKAGGSRESEMPCTRPPHPSQGPRSRYTVKLIQYTPSRRYGNPHFDPNAIGPKTVNEGARTSSSTRKEKDSEGPGSVLEKFRGAAVQADYDTVGSGVCGREREKAGRENDTKRIKGRARRDPCKYYAPLLARALPLNAATTPKNDFRSLSLRVAAAVRHSDSADRPVLPRAVGTDDNSDQKKDATFSATTWASLIPIIVVGVVLTILCVLACSRKSLRRHIASMGHGAAIAAGAPPSHELTADQLAGSINRAHARFHDGPAISTVSLPAYMKEPGDQELVVSRGQDGEDVAMPEASADDTHSNNLNPPSRAYSPMPHLPTDSPLPESETTPDAARGRPSQDDNTVLHHSISINDYPGIPAPTPAPPRGFFASIFASPPPPIPSTSTSTSPLALAYTRTNSSSLTTAPYSRGHRPSTSSSTLFSLARKSPPHPSAHHTTAHQAAPPYRSRASRTPLPHTLMKTELSAFPRGGLTPEQLKAISGTREGGVGRPLGRRPPARRALDTSVTHSPRPTRARLVPPRLICALNYGAQPPSHNVQPSSHGAHSRCAVCAHAAFCGRRLGAASRRRGVRTCGDAVRLDLARAGSRAPDVLRPSQKKKKPSAHTSPKSQRGNMYVKARKGVPGSVAQGTLGARAHACKAALGKNASSTRGESSDSARGLVSTRRARTVQSPLARSRGTPPGLASHAESPDSAHVRLATRLTRARRGVVVACTLARSVRGHWTSSQQTAPATLASIARAAVCTRACRVAPSPLARIDSYRAYPSRRQRTRGFLSSKNTCCKQVIKE